MRLRPSLSALRAAVSTVLLGGAAAIVAGCGGVGVSTAGTVSGNRLTVYSSLPLEGALAPVSRQIVGGEKLALAQVGGRVHRFQVGYASLNDANPKTGEWAPGETATNAKYAAQDSTTIAYLGDFDSEATAVSLPFVNAANIPQVSPASPYVGLTSSLHANQDEPERFYQTGKRTFVRLMPTDPIQAAAQVQLMRTLGIERLYVLEDQDPFDLPLAAILMEDAKRAGINVVGEDTLDTTASTEYAGEAAKVDESHAQAVFFSGLPNTGAVALWQALHAANPHLRLLGSSSLDESAVPGGGGSGEGGTGDSAQGAGGGEGGTGDSAPGTGGGDGESGQGAGGQGGSAGNQAAGGAGRHGEGATAGSSAAASGESSFAARIGAAGRSTYIGSPVLPTSLYPPAAAAVLRSYRATFHETGTAYALYGYEAMSLVLLAIRRAHSHGNDRQDVIDKLFATRSRDGVLGRYSIEANGDSTLSRYGIDQVAHGRLVFYRAFETG